MGEDLSIVLKAMLDQYSLKDVITQINNLSGKTVIKTDLLINDDSLKKIDKSIDGLGERVKKLNKISLFKDSDGKSHKQINELSDALGNIEKRIYTLNKEGKLEFSNSVEIENLEKQKKEYEKIINLLERVDSAKNKVYEDLDSQYGFIDIKGLEKVDNSLNNINLDTENLFTNYKQINSEVTKYEKQLKSLENNANKQRQTVDYNQTIQQVKELENAEKELAKWKEDFSKKNISEADYEILKQETLAKIKSDAIRQQLEEQVRLNAELDKQDTLEREIALTKQNLQNKLTDITVKNDKYSVEELNRLKDSINKVSADTPKAKLKLKELSSEITQFGVEAKKSSSTTNSFSDSLKRFLTFYSLHDVIQTTKRVVKELVDTVYELAESLLEIQKVSNLTGSSLDSFVKQSYKIGDALSKTGKHVIDATTVFKRAGYDLNKSMDLAQNALVMHSVAENIKDVETASISLISVLKGYGFETDKATHIVDAFNQVSNTQATNFDTLVEGASRISAVMKQQGNTFEEMIGLLTGASEVLGADSIERISTQLRTLSLRLASMNEETGKFEPEIVSSLNDEFERLAGISLVDENKQIKSTYEIMSAMARVMPTLDKNTRSYLMELASGKRGMETMEAIMINWENVEKATNSAVNSYGSSADEFQKYTESILGKTEKLKGAWEELAITTLNDDTIAWFLDATTNVIKLTTATGGLTPVVIGLVTAFSLLNAIKIKNTATEIITVFLGMTNGIKGAILALNGLSLASKLFVGSAIVATVMAIGYAINYMSKESDRAKEAVNTLSSELSDLQNKSSNIDSLSTRFIELKGIDKTNEQLKEYYDVQNQIHELLPNVNGYINEQGNFIISEEENVRSLSDAYKILIDEKRKALAESSKESAGYTIDSYSKQKDRIDLLNQYGQQYLELAQKAEQGKLDTTDIDQVNYLQNILGIPLNVADIKKAFSEAQSAIKQSLSTMQSDIRNQLVASDGWDNLGKGLSDSILKELANVDEKTLSILSEGLDNGTISIEQIINGLKKLANETNKITPALTTQKTKFLELQEAFESGKISLSEYTEQIQELNKQTAYYQREINDLSIVQEYLQEVIDKVTNKQSLSKDEVEELVSLYPELENAIYETVDGWSVENDTLNILNTTIGKFQTTYINAQNAISLALKNQSVQRLGIVEAELKGIKSVADAYNLIGGKLDSANNIDDARTEQFWQRGIQTKEYSDVFDIGKAQEDIKKMQEDILKGFNPSALGDSLKSSADKAISEVDRLKQELEKRLQDKEFELSLLGFSGGDDSDRKQIVIYQQMQDEVHKLAQKYREMGLSENDDYIQQLRTQWMDYAENISQLQSVAFDNSNKSIDRILTQLDLQQQLVNDNSQEYIDIEQKKYNEIVKREQLLQNEISRLQAIGNAQAKERAEELIDVYYDTVQQRYNIIKNLQSSQISIYNDQIDELEKQKSALEDLHEFTMQMIKDELNAKKKSIQEEIKGIEEVFNRRKQALRDEQDTRSYDKGLTEKSSVVADLENQLAIIKNDETAIAKRKQLEQELAKAKEDLADYQYEHSIDLQEKALDSELEKVKQTYEDRIDELDETLSNEVRLRELADKKIKQSGEKLYKELINYSKEYGSITEDEIKNAWDNANISLKGYKSTQEDVLDKLKEVTAELSKIENLNLKDYSNKSGLSINNVEQTKAEMKVNSAKWLEASKNNDTEKMKQMAEANQKLGKAMGWYYDSSTGIWWEDKNKKVRIYHGGGIVGGNNYATKSTEELAKLLKGELVITPPQADKLMSMITNNNNNTESFAPEINIIIEGNAEESIIELLKKESKNIANMVASEFNKTRANTGWKKPVKSY